MGRITLNVEQAVVYNNQERSGAATRDNCPNGQGSAAVIYTVPAATYQASSQYEANQLAQADIDANKQAYANQMGICSQQQIPCGQQTSYQGGETFPTLIEVDLGTDGGLSQFIADALDVPDRFRGLIDGVVVFDSGYRGQTSYQQQLWDALAARGDNSQPMITAPGQFTINFTKPANAFKLVVEAYGPIEGTSWSFNVTCPANPL